MTAPRLVFLIWALALALVVWRFSPPELEPDSSEHFAGQHALETLRRLLPDDQPHPLGSPAQDAMRERVMAELRALELEPQLLSAWACSPFGQCGYVHDIIAEIPGEREEAVAFVAHTDSALAGPGAGDDGHAVAILLELARHIQRGTVTPQNSVLLVFTDGEEEGLLGATAFVERSELAARTKVAVNLEARGNAGTSMLFQTVGPSAWMIEAYAAHARAPYCSSLAQPVYELMPNYTDLSALEWGGLTGVDLAFTDGYGAYHSPLDTVDNLSPGALQTQGDNAYALLKGFGEADLSQPAPTDEAVWFDLLGLVVARAPRDLMLPLAGVLWLLILGACVLSRQRGWSEPGALAKASGLALVCVLLAGGLGYGLCELLARVSGEAKFWSAQPWPITIGLVALALALQVAAAQWAKLGPRALLLGSALLQASLGLALAYVAPAAAYVFVLPCAVLVLLGASLVRGDPERVRATAPWICAGVGFAALIVWLPLLHGLRVALGPGAQISASAALAGLWTWSSYEDARPDVAPMLLLLVVFGGASPWVFDPYGEDMPRREWISAVVEDGQLDVVRGPGPNLDPRLHIGGQEISEQARVAAPELLMELERAKPPVGKVLERGEGQLKVRLRSRRGAHSLIVSIPRSAGLHALEVGDASVPAKHIREGRDTRVEIHNVPKQGVTLTATLDDPSAPWRVADRVWWLDAPPELRSEDAQRSWDGDNTYVVTELALAP